MSDARPNVPLAAEDEPLWPVVYEELKRMAVRFMNERPGQVTLQPTALVNEAYLKMGDEAGARNRAHFVAIAATAMRQILVDYSRRRGAEKRGGEWERVTLDGMIAEFDAQAIDPLDLDAAMKRLAQTNERPARVVELRIFGGLTLEETAEVVDATVKMVRNDWRFACAWLKRELGLGLA